MSRNVLAGIVLVLFAGYSCAQSITHPAYTDRAIIEHNNAVVTVVANDPKPLFQAISAIREEYGWRINWEGAPGYSRFDVVDATGPKWRAAHPFAKGVTRPAGSRFICSFSETEDMFALSAGPAVLTKVVQDYNGTDNPGKYDLLAFPDGQFTVVGTQVRDETGALRAVTPLLDTPVTIVKEPRSVYDTVKAILAVLTSTTGKNAIIMSVPNNEFRDNQAAIGGENVPARQLLQQALASTRRPLQYDLGYDPDVPVYVLNVSVAARAADDGFGGKKRIPIDRTH